MAPGQPERFDVVISGASFAGLALARGLRLALGKDVRIALVDRAAGPQPHADNRAFAIWAASKNALAALGVWDAVASVAEPMTSIEITDSALEDGLRPTLLTYNATTSDGSIAGYIVPAGALVAALYDVLQSDDGIRWIAPADAIGLSLQSTHIETHLADGHSLVSSLLVAAEGRQSRLRDAAGIKTTGWDYGQRGIVATVQFSQPHHGIAVQHFLPGGPFAMLPLSENRACITWSSPDAEAQRVLALDPSAFRAELEKRIGGRFGGISVVGEPQSWPLNLKIARELVAPRFALIGDAAHGVHPVAGQGVNLALRDVAALVECLADTARLGFDLGDGAALERYARWRRFDTTMSAAAYDGLNRLFSIDNILLRTVRDAGLGVVDRIGMLKAMIVEEAAGLTGDTPKMLRGQALSS